MINRNYSEKNKCKDCGKLITNTSIRCCSCRSKVSPGNLQDGRTLKKHYKCTDCNTKISKHAFLYGGRRCPSCSIKHLHKIGTFPSYPKGKNAYHFIKGKPKCKCGKELSNYNNKLCRKCNDISKKGIMPEGGFPKGHISQIKSIKYKNILMRSSWEVKYAKWLDNKKIKWQYEQQTFDLGNTTYTPDFYLIDNNEFVEIKGYWYPASKKKFKLFKKLYPYIKISVIKSIKQFTVIREKGESKIQ